MSDTHKILPNSTFTIQDLPTDGKLLFPDREQAEKAFKNGRKQLAELQRRLYAEGKQKLLIVFQAMDAGGKDGTIRKVFSGVNPQGVVVNSFKVPSKEELAHDFLWRIHKKTPATGMINVFNRSHYEDVLVVRVHNYVPESVWRPRYEQINQFEKLLHDNGTRILKFFLHISKDEQKERFQDRLDVPEKNWKFSVDDLRKRTFWDDYMAAYEEMMQQCSTEYAPWYAIPANQKWYRNWAIMNVILNTLNEMAPQYPPPEDDIEGIVVE
ncbi:MAG: polyphosphate kinase 2 family protein [Chloroflexota bacterium]